MNLLWLLVIYIVGAYMIGFLIFGQFSLRKWRDGGSSRTLLFPVTDFIQTFHKRTRIRPFAIKHFNVELALKNNDQIALFNYAMFQALFWPLRLMYIIVMLPIACAVLLIAGCLGCITFIIALLVWIIILKQEEKTEQPEN